MKQVDPELSKIMKRVAAQRKNPHHEFADSEKARQAGLKGAESRWKNAKAKNQETTDKDAESQSRPTI